MRRGQQQQQENEKKKKLASLRAISLQRQQASMCFPRVSPRVNASTHSLPFAVHLFKRHREDVVVVVVAETCAPREVAEPQQRRNKRTDEERRKLHRQTHSLTYTPVTYKVERQQQQQQFGVPFVPSIHSFLRWQLQAHCAFVPSQLPLRATAVNSDQQWQP